MSLGTDPGGTHPTYAADMLLYAGIAEQYADFAAHAGDSPCFADWATRVTQDAEVQAWIARLPAVKQQPNLVFAAARWHGVRAPGPYEHLREALLDDDGAIVATIMTRATQTNEVGRLATLAPAFAHLAAQADRPLALLEAGTSAGLTLYPDRYTMRYLLDDGSTAAWTPGTAGPALGCRVKGGFTVPTAPVDVAWRGGLDLAPLDVHDADAMSWLETLVWPEHDDRRARLRAAIDIARAEHADIRRGDILTDLPALIAEAAEHGQVVVFHSAVAAYLTPEDRERFDDIMRGLVRDGACHWVSNEGAGVLPGITATGPEVPAGHATFVLGIDGQEVAWTHGHGRSMRWHAGPV